MYAQAFIHWPPTPGHNFLLIEMVRKPNIGQIPVFHLWNCSYHTAEELDRLLEIKMPEGLGNALLIRTVAGMWVQTFHITGKVESHPVKTWMQILKELAAMALTTNDDKAFGVSVRRREIFDLIVGPGNDETCMPDIPEMTFDNPTLDDRIFECFINPRFAVSFLHSSIHRGDLVISTDSMSGIRNILISSFLLDGRLLNWNNLFRLSSTRSG